LEKPKIQGPDNFLHCLLAVSI